MSRKIDIVGGALLILACAAASANEAVPRTDAEATRIAAIVRPTGDFTKSEKFEERPGGATTNMTRLGRDAFSQVSANTNNEGELLFKVGNGLFKKLWVSAPASTQASDGLGPLYNARACQRCHIKDGRGHPPDGPDDDGVSMLLRLSIPRASSDLNEEVLAYLSEAPEPTYGLQLQDKSIAGVAAEGRIGIAYEEVPVELADGTVISLRNPTYSVTDSAYGRGCVKSR